MQDEKEMPAEEARPQHGKRVVEITQPARRPARMERMAAERRAEVAAEPEAAEAARSRPRPRRATGAELAE